MPWSTCPRGHPAVVSEGAISPMTSILHAGAVTVGPLDNGLEHAAWAEDGLEGLDGTHLILMRRTGDPDGYCVVVNGIPHYGGVLAWEVEGDETRLTLDRGAAADLGLERDVSLQHLPGAVDTDVLKAVIGRLLG
jgi:hypothetical protein